MSTRLWAGLAVVVAAMGAPFASAAQPERVIEADAALADARLARRGIEMIHPGLDRYTDAAEVGAGFDRLEAACAAAITEREFYGLLSLALAKVRCSHTKAEPSATWEAWRAATASYLPLRFLEHEGRMIVRASVEPGVRRGDEIVSIDGVPAATVMATLLGAVPADGWTDGARKFALSSISDLDESEFDHFYPAFFPVGEKVRLEVRTPGEARARSVVSAWMTKEARQRALAEPPVARNLDEAVSLEVRSGGVAVMTVGTFVAYRKKIDPEDIYRPLFERVATEKIGTLVLDLRGNSGGSDEAALDLMRFLVDEPIVPATKKWMKTYRFGELADALETWDRSVLNMPAQAFTELDSGYFELKQDAPVEFAPLQPAFGGRLIVLCGPANASGATMFLGSLKQKREVTLVGEETGGSVEGPTAGTIFFLPLPNTGVRVRIPAIRSVTGLRGGGAGGGMAPDVVVRPSVEEALSGRDAVLERALRLAAE